MTAPTPAAEKAGLDPKGLEAAREAHSEAASRRKHLWEMEAPLDMMPDPAEAAIRAYLEATPDAQYRRGAEDMREAAIKVADGYAQLPSSVGHIIVADLRALPFPTPDEGEKP